MLILEKEKIDDRAIRSILTRTEQRIRALFTMHEQLYQAPDLAQIHFGDYLEGLVSNLKIAFSTYAGWTEIEVQCGDVLLSIYHAIPCAMIINELLSNSLKHAFGPESPGKIKLRVEITAGPEPKGFMEVRDNGRGLPDGFKVEDSSSLGLTLVQALSEQINADFSYLNDAGAVFSISFPL